MGEEAILQVMGELSSLAVQAVTKLWRSHSQELSNQSFWDYVQDMYPELITPSVDMAADLGVEWYNAMGTDEVAKAAPSPDPEMLKVSARWAMSQGDAVTGLQLLSGSSVRRVYDGLRDTIKLSTELEEGATFARRARPNACPFCRMLAIRGDVYRSAQTALVGADGNPYHDHCHCLAVPVRPGQIYEPPAYVDQWEQEYLQARALAGSGDPKEILRAWDQVIADGGGLQLVAGPTKYDDEAYRRMSPEEKKKERARRRREAAKKETAPKPVVKPEPPKPEPDDRKIKYDDEAYRQMSPEEKKRERARRRAALRKEGQLPPSERQVKVTRPKEKAVVPEPSKGEERGRAAAYAGTNPNYVDRRRGAEQYRVNCQRVVMAYELRRRGYNVEALGNPNPATTGLSNQAIRQHWKGDRTYAEHTSPQAMEAEILQQPKGARGFIAACWLKGSAHIWNYEVIEARDNRTGEIRKAVMWLENQSDEFHPNSSAAAAVKNAYTNRINWKKTAPFKPWYMRTDDLEPNWDLMKANKIFKEVPDDRLQRSA